MKAQLTHQCTVRWQRVIKANHQSAVRFTKISSSASKPRNYILQVKWCLESPRYSLKLLPSVLCRPSRTIRKRLLVRRWRSRGKSPMQTQPSDKEDKTWLCSTSQVKVSMKSSKAKLCYGGTCNSRFSHLAMSMVLCTARSWAKPTSTKCSLCFSWTIGHETLCRTVTSIRHWLITLRLCCWATATKTLKF